jgi:hypothetical protein
MPTKEVMEACVTNFQFQRKTFPHQFDQSILQLERMVDGEQDIEAQSLRSKYYQGWTNDDLRELMDKANA